MMLPLVIAVMPEGADRDYIIWSGSLWSIIG